MKLLFIFLLFFVNSLNAQIVSSDDSGLYSKINPITINGYYVERVYIHIGVRQTSDILNIAIINFPWYFAYNDNNVWHGFSFLFSSGNITYTIFPLTTYFKQLEDAQPILFNQIKNESIYNFTYK